MRLLDILEGIIAGALLLLFVVGPALLTGKF